MYLFPWDPESGLTISRDTCENWWLGFHFVSECWCLCLGSSLFGTSHRFLSRLLRNFSCTANKTFHELFGMLSQSQSDLRWESRAAAQARWTLSPMLQAFGKQSQSWVLFGVYDRKLFQWDDDLHTEPSICITLWWSIFHLLLFQFFCFELGSILLWVVCRFAGNIAVLLSAVCLTAYLDYHNPYCLALWPSQ